MLQSGETGGSGFTASVFQSLAGLRLPLRQRETSGQHVIGLGHLVVVPHPHAGEQPPESFTAQHLLRISSGKERVSVKRTCTERRRYFSHGSTAADERRRRQSAMGICGYCPPAARLWISEERWMRVRYTPDHGRERTLSHRRSLARSKTDAKSPLPRGQRTLRGRNWTLMRGPTGLAVLRIAWSHVR